MLYDTLPPKMANKNTTSNVTNEPQVEDTYSFPEWGIAVSASSIEEATEKAKALLKEKDNG